MCLPFLAPLGTMLGASASGAAAAGTMAVVSAASTALSAVGAINQASAAKQTARNNATMAEYAAQDAQRRGEHEAESIRRKGASIKSAQRAAFAGKGLDVSYGNAADIQDQTDFFTESDIATTRTNARREAWNYRAQGQQALAMGKADSLNSMLAAGGTLLGGAGRVADKWYANSYGESTATSSGRSLYDMGF